MVLRKRSMSVCVAKDENRLSRKFEGVTSDNDAQTDSDEEEERDRFQSDERKSAIIEEEDETLSDSWTKADYDLLIEKMREALPKKDNKRYKTSLQLVKWENIEIRHHSTQEIEQVAKSLITKARRFRTLGEVLDDVPDVVLKVMSADKPKAPMSAYNLYVRDHQSRVREEATGDLKMTDIFKMLSKEYHQLPEKKRRRYEDTANRMKAEYKANLKKFYEEHPELIPRKKIRKSKAVHKTPFNMFYQARREISCNITQSQARKEWEDLPMKKKLKFIRASFEEEDAGKLNKKEQEILDRFHGKPDYVGRNVFDFYKRKTKPNYEGSGLSGMDRERKMGEEWKKITERQVMDMKEEYAAARTQYILQYRAFIANLPKEKQQAEIEFLQGQMGKGKKKKVTEKLVKVDELYLGSDDEDPPVAESTTIKKPVNKHKQELSSDSEEEEEDAPLLPSPSKKVKMAPPAVPKLPPVKTAKKASVVNNKKSDPIPPPIRSDSSSSDESTTKTVVSAAVSTSGQSRNESVVKSEPGRSPEEVAVAAAQLQKLAAMKKPKKTKVEKPEPSTKPVPPAEPERPPKQIEEFYRQRIYKGKVGKHKESFANLSAAKKRDISELMKEAQKQYIVDFENYLKSLPRDEIRRYIQKVNAQKKDETGSDEDEEEDEEEDDDGSSSEEEEDDD